jgi:hypothetical protein
MWTQHACCCFRAEGMIWIGWLEAKKALHCSDARELFIYWMHHLLVVSLLKREFLLACSEVHSNLWCSFDLSMRDVSKSPR